MAKVIGVGGIFWRSKDPSALAAWYKKWLGMPVGDGWAGATFAPSSLPQHAYTVWSPFKASTDYFGAETQSFMINLIVDDLTTALSQVKEGGAELVGETESNEYGHFGWFNDPDGNKVELWQPSETP